MKPERNYGAGGRYSGWTLKELCDEMGFGVLRNGREHAIPDLIIHIQEQSDEIERLQKLMKLPEDLEEFLAGLSGMRSDEENLERDDSGDPFYFHLPGCPSPCGHACNRMGFREAQNLIFTTTIRALQVSVNEITDERNDWKKLHELGKANGLRRIAELEAEIIKADKFAKTASETSKTYMDANMALQAELQKERERRDINHEGIDPALLEDI